MEIKKIEKVVNWQYLTANRLTGQPANWLTNKGQSVLEYAIILAIVSAACVTMVIYVRRAVQGQLYNIENQITPKMTAKPQVVS